MPGWGSVTLSLSARLRCRHALGLRAPNYGWSSSTVFRFMLILMEMDAPALIYFGFVSAGGAAACAKRTTDESRVDMPRTTILQMLRSHDPFCVRLFRWNCKNDGRHRCTCSQPQHTAHIFLTLPRHIPHALCSAGCEFFGGALDRGHRHAYVLTLFRPYHTVAPFHAPAKISIWRQGGCSGAMA